jgi:L-xylulose reductase
MTSAAVSYLFGGKTALVTGAGRGIGRATAKALSAAGAVTYALSKTKENLDSLKTECPDIRPIRVDISDWSSTRRAVESVGPVDFLVNNAAVFIMQPFLDVDPRTFDSTYNVNVKAVINISQVVVQGMIQRRSPGSIVNVSSIGSCRAFVDHTVYNSSKGALDQVTRIMALELGPHGIRVNGIQPTSVMTDMGLSEYEDNPAEAEMFKAKHPLRKFAEVHEVVDTIMYLLSDKSSMIHGVILPVDGGYLTQ